MKPRVERRPEAGAERLSAAMARQDYRRAPKQPGRHEGERELREQKLGADGCARGEGGKNRTPIDINHAQTIAAVV
jgi:hypothetical protein